MNNDIKGRFPKLSKPTVYLVAFMPQVLFLELHLPPNGDVDGPRSKKTLGYTRRGGGRARLGKQFSTTKVQLFCVFAFYLQKYFCGYT